MLEIDQKSNNLDQCNRRNNCKIQGIPASVTDDELKGKVADIFSHLSNETKGADIADHHILGYANPKSTIVRFVNHKFCYQACDKKMEFIS